MLRSRLLFFLSLPLLRVLLPDRDRRRLNGLLERDLRGRRGDLDLRLLPIGDTERFLLGPGLLDFRRTGEFFRLPLSSRGLTLSRGVGLLDFALGSPGDLERDFLGDRVLSRCSFGGDGEWEGDLVLVSFDLDPLRTAEPDRLRFLRSLLLERDLRPR